MRNISNVCSKSNLMLSFTRLINNPESIYKIYFKDDYSMYAMSLNENIKILRNKLKAGYLPENTIRVFMPKSNGLNRMYTLLSIEDQVVYQAYANIIAEKLCNIPKVKQRYNKSIFGNLYSGLNDCCFYQNWQQSYKLYTKAIVDAYLHGNIYIASFDLTACYDSINHQLLKEMLKKKCLFSDNCANSFINLIGKWESSNEFSLGTGIPQGPQASGIVAEMVLEEYDSCIENLQKELSFQYFRYVDDIKILSNNIDIVKWVMFCLDIKSKKLGLFPQISKITIHKIHNIDDEIKRISKPLFDEELADNKKSEIAITTIRKLIKQKSKDLTTIKRYLQCVNPNTKSNKLVINIVNNNPNMVHSFAYYVQRYPRKLPPVISNYIYECCMDRTKQFIAGLLLESAFCKMSNDDMNKFSLLGRNVLIANKEKDFIVDSRLKAMLIFLILKVNDKSVRNIINIANKSDWYVKSKLLHEFCNYNLATKINKSLVLNCLQSASSNEALASSRCVLIDDFHVDLPEIKTISNLAQNILKCSNKIQRRRYLKSQISVYINEIIGKKFLFQWRKKMRREHDWIEKTLYTAVGYWISDLTAFVNLWDTLDDKICGILTKDHVELGGYQIGNIGGIKDSTGFISYLPKFYSMCVEIHRLRLSSHLSHAEIKKTQQYTGPISQKKRKFIKKILTEGLQELFEFW